MYTADLQDVDVVCGLLGDSPRETRHAKISCGGLSAAFEALRVVQAHRIDAACHWLRVRTGLAEGELGCFGLALALV